MTAGFLFLAFILLNVSSLFFTSLKILSLSFALIFSVQRFDNSIFHIVFLMFKLAANSFLSKVYTLNNAVNVAVCRMDCMGFKIDTVAEPECFSTCVFVIPLIRSQHYD